MNEYNFGSFESIRIFSCCYHFIKKLCKGFDYGIFDFLNQIGVIVITNSVSFIFQLINCTCNSFQWIRHNIFYYFRKQVIPKICCKIRNIFNLWHLFIIVDNFRTGFWWKVWVLDELCVKFIFWIFYFLFLMFSNFLYAHCQCKKQKIIIQFKIS